MSSLLKRFTTKRLNHRDYYKYLNRSSISKIEKLSSSLKGARILELNTDPKGGGVAVMLSTLVPLYNSLGLEASWKVVPPDQRFFEITKKLHNLLQGKGGALTAAEKGYYTAFNRGVAEMISELEFDLLEIHDPQPLAVIQFLKKRTQKKIWRCHIDTTTPNIEAWNFIKEYIGGYDHFIFTAKEYTDKDFPDDQISLFTPAIDPLHIKNRKIDAGMAKKIVSSLNIDLNRPFITQVSRFDPWKDPLGVIETFNIVRKNIPELQLVFVAQTSTDDPEETILHRQLLEFVHGDPDIKFIVDIPNNDIVVNAFQTISDVIVQKSIREGFGLTVSESMWKRNIVVGGNTTGIRLQISSGINGFIVNNNHECAKKIIEILTDKKMKKKIGGNAHYTVKKRFLITNLLKNYLSLFNKLLH